VTRKRVAMWGSTEPVPWGRVMRLRRYAPAPTTGSAS